MSLICSTSSLTFFGVTPVSIISSRSCSYQFVRCWICPLQNICSKNVARSLDIFGILINISWEYPASYDQEPQSKVLQLKSVLGKTKDITWKIREEQSVRELTQDSILHRIVLNSSNFRILLPITLNKCRLTDFILIIQSPPMWALAGK